MLKADPNEASYYEHFGRFIAAYSNAETSVHSLARHYSGTEDSKARLLIGGLRLGDVTERLRALMEISFSYPKGILSPGGDQDRVDEIESCLVQLSIVTDKRHKLIHRSLSYSAAGFQLTDILTVKKLVNFETNLVTLKDMKAMYFDCMVISLTLNDWQRDPAVPPYWDAEHPRPPWRYIPPKPPLKPEVQLRASRKEVKRRYRASVVKSRGKTP